MKELLTVLDMYQKNIHYDYYKEEIALFTKVKNTLLEMLETKGTSFHKDVLLAIIILHSPNQAFETCEKEFQETTKNLDFASKFYIYYPLFIQYTKNSIVKKIKGVSKEECLALENFCIRYENALQDVFLYYEYCEYVADKKRIDDIIDRMTEKKEKSQEIIKLAKVFFLNGGVKKILDKLEKKAESITIFDTTQFNQFRSLFHTHLKNLQKKDIQYKKEKTKELESVKRLCKEMREMKKDNYFFLKEEYVNRLPLDILIRVNETIMKYNEALYEKVRQENTSLSLESINALFRENGFSNQFNQQEIENLQQKDLVQINGFLQQLKEFSFSLTYSNQEWLYLCFTATKEQIEIVKEGISCGLFTLSFVLEHVEVFCLPANKTIKNNIEWIKKNGLSTACLNQGLLAKDLPTYLFLAQKYTLSLEDQNILENILKPHFFTDLDIWIEMGLFPLLKKDSTLFSEDLLLLSKRIRIAQSLQLPYVNEEGKLLSIITKDFFISDDKLDDYIENQSFYLKKY